MADETPDSALLRTETAHPAQPLVPAEQVSIASATWRYEQVEEIGSGGMGTVFRAFDPDLERHVALKLLRRERASPDNRARLLREARAMAKLSHPNVLGVYEVATEGGHDYIAMELIEGGNLAQWLDGGERSHSERLRVMLEAGRGLQAAHAAGLIHRDFKPANVMISADGRVLVGDFGLARRTDQPDDSSSSDRSGSDEANTLTRTGSIVGTPLFMSPEQHDGLAADARSDQFSFCVATYRALYGSMPFPGETLAEVRAHIERGAAQPENDELPRRIREALWRGFSVDPAARFTDMGALLSELALGMQPRRRWRIAAAVAAVAVVVTLVAVLSVGSRSVEAPRPAGGPCASIEAQFDRAWGAARAQQLRGSFARFDTSGKAFAAFARAMDDYRRRWTDAYARACEARPGGEDAFHLGLGCLLRKRNRVASFVAEYDKADRAMVAGAFESVSGLANVNMCAAATKPASPEFPPEPAKRKAVLALRRELSAIYALRRSADRRGEALKRARAGVANARGIDFPPLLAEAHIALGYAAVASNFVPRARAAFNKAIELAEIASDSDLQARALLGLANLELNYSSNWRRTRTVIKRAESAVKRAGAEPVRLAHLQLIAARIDVRTGRHDAALALAAEAKLAFERAGDRLGVAEAHATMATAERAAGRYDYALAYYRKHLAFLQREAGLDSHAIAMTLESIAEMLSLLGRFDQSRQMSQRAAALFEHTEQAKTWRTRGRTPLASGAQVRGRVVDASGKPLAGVRVIGSIHGFWGDGKYVDGRQGVHYNHDHFVRRATSATDGSFALASPPTDSTYYVVAEHDVHGRSRYVPLTTGQRNEVTLIVQRFGAVEGTLVATGKRALTYHLHVVSPAYQLLTFNRLEIQFDGDKFRIPRLPAGEHLIHVAEGEQFKQSVAAALTVVVKPGQTTRVTLRVDFGGALTVFVDPESAGAMPSSAVGLFAGHHTMPTNVGGMIALYSLVSRGARAVMQLAQPMPGSDSHSAALRDIAPGAYTVCAGGLGGDIFDPRYLAQIQARPNLVPVRCRHVNLSTEQPDRIVRIKVPPVPRLAR